MVEYAQLEGVAHTQLCSHLPPAPPPAFPYPAFHSALCIVMPLN